MKFFSILLFFSLIVSCGSKQKSKDDSSAKDKAGERSSLLNDCSLVDTSIDEFWILLCQREPHPNRPELYEYSLFFRTFKRLTYQDGQIQDFAVIGIDDIVYSSTYDEAKEKFLAVSKGVSPGTDLYLRKRTVTDFKRLTKDDGSDHSLFHSKELKSLLFVNSNSKGHVIKKLGADQKVTNLIKVRNRPTFSPITLADQSLVWFESDAEKNKSFLMKQSLKEKDPQTLFSTASKILTLRPQPSGSGVWVAFSTGMGTELWSYDLEKDCFSLHLQNQKKWTRFQFIEGDQIEISVENSGRVQLHRDRLNRSADNCQTSPPRLGIER